MKFLSSLRFLNMLVLSTVPTSAISILILRTFTRTGPSWIWLLLPALATLAYIIGRISGSLSGRVSETTLFLNTLAHIWKLLHVGRHSDASRLVGGILENYDGALRYARELRLDCESGRDDPPSS